MKQFQIFLLVFSSHPPQAISFSTPHIHHLFDFAWISLFVSALLGCTFGLWSEATTSLNQQEPPFWTWHRLNSLLQSLLTWFVHSTVIWFECWQRSMPLTVSISHCENLMTSRLGIWIVLFKCYCLFKCYNLNKISMKIIQVLLE